MVIAEPFNVEISGFLGAVKAAGYPMQTEVEEWKNEEPIEKHLLRASKLGNTAIGSGHDNFLNGIVVSFDIALPVKVWTEMQRYHFLDIVSSMSSMHRLANMDLDNCFDCNVDERVIEILKQLQCEYRKAQEKANQTHDKSDVLKAKQAYLKLLLTCPTGLILTARVVTNYRQLKTIYAQRKNHRLPHWQIFCEWVSELPYAKTFGIVNVEK